MQRSIDYMGQQSMQIHCRNLKKKAAPIIILDLSGQYDSRSFQTHNVTAHNDEHTGYSLLDLCLCT